MLAAGKEREEQVTGGGVDARQEKGAAAYSLGSRGHRRRHARRYF